MNELIKLWVSVTKGKEIEEFESDVQKLYDYTMNLQKENQQLKDNWNKLKEFIVKEYYMYLPLEASTKSITILIDKMQEMEGSDSNVKK